jgi:hypothetical protein
LTSVFKALKSSINSTGSAILFILCAKFFNFEVMLLAVSILKDGTFGKIFLKLTQADQE